MGVFQFNKYIFFSFDIEKRKVTKKKKKKGKMKCQNITNVKRQKLEMDEPSSERDESDSEISAHNDQETHEDMNQNTPDQESESAEQMNTQRLPTIREHNELAQSIKDKKQTLESFLKSMNINLAPWGQLKKDLADMRARYLEIYENTDENKRENTNESENEDDECKNADPAIINQCKTVFTKLFNDAIDSKLSNQSMDDLKELEFLKLLPQDINNDDNVTRVINNLCQLVS